MNITAHLTSDINVTSESISMQITLVKSECNEADYNDFLVDINKIAAGEDISVAVDIESKP